MSYRLLRLIYAAAFWLFFIPAFAQPYKTLTVNDFKAMPSSLNGETVAYTNCSIDYRYQAHKEKNYYLLNFTIALQMNDCLSWVDKTHITSPGMMAEVLKHEQGHYNIAYMEQQELLRTISRTVFYADYQAEAADIFNRIDAKYKKLNHDYDADTQHMVNRQEQQSWNAYFKQKLDFMPPVKD